MIRSLITQYKGIINLAFPVMVLYFWNPSIFANQGAIIAVGLIMGGFVAYLNYKNAYAQTQVLAFKPLDLNKTVLEESVAACGLQPNNVHIRYAFADDGVALTILNTVVIDPLMWKNLGEDKNAQKAKQVVDTHIIPTLSQEKKILLNQIQEILSVPAQTFIFKHELGHVWYNYSMKKILVIGIIGFLFTVAGLETALCALPYMSGILAALLAIVVTGAVDFLLSYGSNVVFKYRHEIKADLFAARHSSEEEVFAAADFFEQYQKYADEYKKTRGTLYYLPQIIASGHPDGKSRADYLRTISSKLFTYKN